MSELSKKYPFIPGPWSFFRIDSPLETVAVTGDHSVKWVAQKTRHELESNDTPLVKKPCALLIVCVLFFCERGQLRRSRPSPWLKPTSPGRALCGIIAAAIRNHESWLYDQKRVSYIGVGHGPELRMICADRRRSCPHSSPSGEGRF